MSPVEGGFEAVIGDHTFTAPGISPLLLIDLIRTVRHAPVSRHALIILALRQAKNMGKCLNVITQSGKEIMPIAGKMYYMVILKAFPIF